LNLIAGAPLWLIVLLGCAMIAAAVEDMARYRISNLTSLAVFAMAACAILIEGFSTSLWQNAVVFCALLVLGTAAFSAGLMGGGDVKLFAAAGLWVDLRSALSLIALIFLAGGLVAVAYLASRALRGAAPMKDRKVPYGIAIALGSLALIGFMRAPHHASYRDLPPLKTVAHH
jgi:prepilin peptidase CpaA